MSVLLRCICGTALLQTELFLDYNNIIKKILLVNINIIVDLLSKRAK